MSRSHVGAHDPSASQGEAPPRAMRRKEKLKCDCPASLGGYPKGPLRDRRGADSLRRVGQMLCGDKARMIMAATLHHRAPNTY
jgi:hypothetical protein